MKYRTTQYLFARWMLALLPIVFGALWCANRALGRQRCWQEISAGVEEVRDGSGVLAFFKALISGRIFHSPEVARLDERIDFDFDLSNTFFAFLRGCALGACWGCYAYVAVIPSAHDLANFALPISVSLILGVILWLDIFARWRARRQNTNHRRRAARFGLRLLRESWLGWLALGSAVFFLTLLISTPLRMRADAALDRVLQLGEVKALQSQ